MASYYPEVVPSESSSSEDETESLAAYKVLTIILPLLELNYTLSSLHCLSCCQWKKK